jgi:predicted enzyme related to lactoylglutathione lyase
MKHNPIGWFEIYVQDMARARGFYETVLGRKLEKLEAGGLEMWSFTGEMQAPGAAGALVHMPGCPSGGNSTLVYFVCEDCAVEEGRVKAAGGRVEKPKFSIGPYGFVALACDTEGNMFGLHSMK